MLSVSNTFSVSLAAFERMIYVFFKQAKGQGQITSPFLLQGGTIHFKHKVIKSAHWNGQLDSEIIQCFICKSCFLIFLYFYIQVIYHGANFFFFFLGFCCNSADSLRQIFAFCNSRKRYSRTPSYHWFKLYISHTRLFLSTSGDIQLH